MCATQIRGKTDKVGKVRSERGKIQTTLYKCVQRELQSSFPNRGAVRRADALL